MPRAVGRVRPRLDSELFTLRRVGHEHADVFARVTVFDERVHGGLGRKARLEKSRHKFCHKDLL
jgi:hypothetical protein